MKRRADKEVIKGLWERRDSPKVVKIDKEFAQQMLHVLQTGSEVIDEKISLVISEAQENIEEEEEEEKE